jgi:hypothetical protein
MTTMPPARMRADTGGASLPFHVRCRSFSINSNNVGFLIDKWCEIQKVKIDSVRFYVRMISIAWVPSNFCRLFGWQSGVSCPIRGHRTNQV